MTPRRPSPAAKISLTTRMGERAELRVPPGRVHGKVVLDVLQLGGEPGHLPGLGVVTDGDEGLEGGLGVEPAVLVGLVGTEGGLDGGVELHPGHVARRSSRRRGARRRRASRKRLRVGSAVARGGLAELRGGERRARSGTRPSRGPAASPAGVCRITVKKPRAAARSFCGQGGHPGRRSPPWSRREGRRSRPRAWAGARDEDPVVVEPVPRPLVPQEEGQARPAERRRVVEQAEQHAVRARPTAAAGRGRPPPGSPRRAGRAPSAPPPGASRGPRQDPPGRTGPRAGGARRRRGASRRRRGPARPGRCRRGARARAAREWRMGRRV